MIIIDMCNNFLCTSYRTEFFGENYTSLYFLFICSFWTGSAFLQLDPNTVILGDDNITISCLDRFIKHVELQIRLNKSDDWKTIAMVNLTRTYLTNYDINFGDFSVIWHQGICFDILNKCFIEVKIRVHSRRCKLDPESIPMLRCSSFDGEKRFYSEEKSFPGVKGIIKLNKKPINRIWILFFKFKM